MDIQKDKIDFVITWVDGADSAWRKEKSRYTGEEDKASDEREERYRDYGLLKYWFRGVEKYAPWVNKIYFVTWGHIPSWLDTNHEKLVIVNHKDMIPDEYLPTFNSNAIEMFLHRIPELSEQFVYFNDDVFPIAPLKPTDFFEKAKPCDMLAFQPVVANADNPTMSYIYLNNILTLAKHFDKRQNVKAQRGKYFKLGYPPLYFFYNLLELAFPRYTGLYTIHGPFPFLKSTFEKVWEKEADVLKHTAMQRIRSKEDVSIYLMREWQKLEGNFEAKNVQKHLAYYNLGENDDRLCREIQQPKHKVVCINDANTKIDFETTKQSLDEAFLSLFPKKSKYERD